MATNKNASQLTAAQCNKLSKSLDSLVAKSKKQPISQAFKTLGTGLSGLGSKFEAQNDNLDTTVTDNLGEQLFHLHQALEDSQYQQECSEDEPQAYLADAITSAAMGVLALGDSIKPPASLEDEAKNTAKLLGSISEFRDCAADLAEHMICLAAEQYQVEGNEILSISIPALPSMHECACHQSPLKLANPPIQLASVESDFSFVEGIGVSEHEMAEMLRVLLELLVLLAIILSIMPAVGCTNNCTEGALRATMAAHGSDAQGNSTFDIKWEYCCIEACFLWVTGTYWHDEGTTSHTAGNPLGRNRRVPATRRAKRVGTAAAAWLTNGGPIPALMRRHRVKPNMIAPTSTC